MASKNARVRCYKHARVMSLPSLTVTTARYAGRAFETEAAAEAGTGTLVVKGLTSTWRQAAPIVSFILGGALQRVIMQHDVAGAVAFVQQHVALLLSGALEPWHCTMTGGLWRVTGQQVAAAAAADGRPSVVSWAFCLQPRV